MPTYEYQCDACGHAFEQFQSITAGALRKCPKCRKSKLRRLLGTGAGVLFKGSGFYATDYRSGGNGGGSGKKDTSEAKTPSPCESCSNAKSCEQKKGD